MRIATVTLGNGAVVRTVACGLPAAIARYARDEAHELEATNDPAEVTARFLRVCGALKDATRAALALDALHATLTSVRRALDGDEDCDLGAHEAVREARDLRIRITAVKRCAAEIEVPDTHVLAAELSAALDRVADAREEAWDVIREATRVLSWVQDSAIRRASDVGLCLRSAARIGVLPAQVDMHLAFASAPDHNAPEGSPAHNTATVLRSLVMHEAQAQADRREDEERATKELVARITEVCEGEPA